MFGLQGPQIQAAGSIGRILGEEWKGLLVGAEGFLVPQKTVTESKESWPSAWEEKVVWGVQVSLPDLSSLSNV